MKLAERPAKLKIPKICVSSWDCLDLLETSDHDWDRVNCSSPFFVASLNDRASNQTRNNIAYVPVDIQDHALRKNGCLGH